MLIKGLEEKFAARFRTYVESHSGAVQAYRAARAREAERARPEPAVQPPPAKKPRPAPAAQPPPPELPAERELSRASATARSLAQQPGTPPKGEGQALDLGQLPEALRRGLEELGKEHPLRPVFTASREAASGRTVLRCSCELTAAQASNGRGAGARAPAGGASAAVGGGSQGPLELLAVLSDSHGEEADFR